MKKLLLIIIALSIFGCAGDTPFTVTGIRKFKKNYTIYIQDRQGLNFYFNTKCDTNYKIGQIILK